MTERESATVAALRSALDEMGELVAGVRPDQWASASNCPEWDVRALVQHVVYGNRYYTGTLSGQGRPDRGRVSGLPDQDQLGDDPSAAWQDSAAGMLSAFGAPGVLEQTFPSPLGPMPGAGLAGLRLTETLVHGWDLARSTGQSPAFDDAVAQNALDFTTRSLPPGADRSSFPFAAERPVSADAPAIVRLAAHLGRSVAAG